MTTVAALADELTELVLDASPVFATLLGVPGREDRLADLTEAGEQELDQALVGVLERARALDPAALSPADRATRAVVVSTAEGMRHHLAAHEAEYTITDMFVAPVASMLSTLPMLVLSTPKQAAGYLARLSGLPAMLADVAQRHRGGISAGRVPVAHLVRAAIDQIDRYLAAPDQDPLARPTFEGELPDGREFTAARDEVLAERVRPAFARYRDVLADAVLPHGRDTERVGLCWLPGGDAMYAGLVAAHTTTDRTPEDLHDTGLALIARLADEYREVGERVFGTRDLAVIFDRLRTDPALRWDTADELLDTARTAIARAEAAAPDWFGRLPAQSCQVVPVPEVEAAGAPGAYYLPPALDGSRPGTYFANTHRVGERFRYVAEATAFHEAVPGHHFQLTLAQELTDLPLLRRAFPITAYAEGWGLYTERLADEMGLYSDDVARLGLLTTDSMRAGRLVVDTGLHAKGWSRQQAIDYLRDNTAMAPVEIESEVDRYIAYPGQALAYMVGRLEIQRLRAEAERALGDRFDIRAFHDTVLGSGALPLPELAAVVADWITARS
jgi:uncharacterized protein (DUF885 family)